MTGVSENMPAPEKSNPNARLYAGNLDFSLTRRDLERIFGVYGPLADIYVPRQTEDPSLNRGHAFIEFEDERDAQRAIHGCHNLRTGREDRRAFVRIADARTSRPKTH